MQLSTDALIRAAAATIIWIAFLSIFSGVRSLFKYGIKWRNGNVWAVLVSSIVVWFAAYLSCDCGAGQNSISYPTSVSDIKHLVDAANNGNPQAEEKLARMYNDGTYMKQNYGEAARWFQKAAEHGDISAQVNLAGMYERGEGVGQSYVESYFWFSIAVKSGNRTYMSARDSVAKHLTEGQRLSTDRRIGQWKQL